MPVPSTGELGTAASEPGLIVPMFGAGGHKYAQSLSGQLSFTGAIASAITNIFTQISVTVYRAVGRAIQGWSEYSTVVLGDNPIGYWRLADNNSTSIFDYSGFLNLGAGHGTLTVSQTGALNDSSNSMLFDGSTAYIQIPFSNPLAPKPNFSIELLTKGPHQSSTATMFGDTNAAITKGLRLIANTSGSVTFDVNGGSGAISSSALSTTAWHHIVGTYDGTNTRLYVDGALVAGPTAGTYTPNDGTALYIGAQLGSSSFFSGSLQEIALYPYALTAQQVTIHYNAFALIPSAGMFTITRTLN